MRYAQTTFSSRPRSVTRGGRVSGNHGRWRKNARSRHVVQFKVGRCSVHGSVVYSAIHNSQSHSIENGPIRNNYGRAVHVYTVSTRTSCFNGSQFGFGILEAQCTPPAPVTNSALQHTALRPLRVARSPFTCGQGITRSDHVVVHVVSDHGGRSRTVRENQEQRVHARSQSIESGEL